jgi:3-oxoacyl-[acyl-carrier-protein] synthase II
LVKRNNLYVKINITKYVYIIYLFAFDSFFINLIVKLWVKEGLGLKKQSAIVVTGMGTVTPFGVGVDRFWRCLITGKSAVRNMSDDYLRQWAPVAAPVALFQAKDYITAKMARTTDRFSQFALAAANEAMHGAGWTGTGALGENYRPTRIGVAVGCALGGIRTLENGADKLARGKKHLEPRLVPKSIPNAAAAAIARQWNIHGPVITYSTACASSVNAIGEALNWFSLGLVDMAVVGGAECLFSPAILAGLRSAGALAKAGPDNPAMWSRPFAADRQGMVMGEGAGILVLETAERALRRGADIYAELAGYGTSNDAYHETAPDPSGEYAALAMEQALRRAGIAAAAVDYVNAHATATQAGDAAECAALRRVFADRLDRLPVSSIKGAVGHLLGAAGAVESIACIQALRTAVLPPTINCTPKDLIAPADIVPNVGRHCTIRYAMSNSFGFGGQNGVLIWSKAG